MADSWLHTSRVGGSSPLSATKVSDFLLIVVIVFGRPQRVDNGIEQNQVIGSSPFLRRMEMMG